MFSHVSLSCELHGSKLTDDLHLQFEVFTPEIYRMLHVFHFHFGSN